MHHPATPQNCYSCSISIILWLVVGVFALSFILPATNGYRLDLIMVTVFGFDYPG